MNTAMWATTSSRTRRTTLRPQFICGAGYRVGHAGNVLRAPLIAWGFSYSRDDRLRLV